MHGITRVAREASRVIQPQAQRTVRKFFYGPGNSGDEYLDKVFWAAVGFMWGRLISKPSNR